jgi:hypothetical protein
MKLNSQYEFMFISKQIPEPMYSKLAPITEYYIVVWMDISRAPLLPEANAA